MDFSVFQTTVQAFVFTPEEQRKRALSVAQVLEDADRVEFLRGLQETERQLAETAKEQMECMDQYEHVVTEAEHLLRKVKEEEGQEQDLLLAEQNLSTSS